MSETRWERRLLEHLTLLAEQALAPDLLEQIAEWLYVEFGSPIAILNYSGPDRLDGGVVVRGFEPEWVRRFGTHYHTVNPYPHVVEEHGLRDATANLGNYFSRPRLWRTEYYNDFMRPQCLDHVMALSIDGGGGARTSFSLYRGEHEGGPFSADDVRRLDMLRPHLRQTLLLRRLWTTVQASQTSLAAACEGLGQPALLSIGGRLQPLNEAGEERLRRRNRRGVSPDGEGGAVIPFLAAPRIVNGGVDVDPSGAAVVILSPQNAAGRARERWGLSKRETEVLVALREGLSAREIAGRLEISVTTVQTHVKSIHRKSGFGTTRKLLGALADEE